MGLITSQSCCGCLFHRTPLFCGGFFLTSIPFPLSFLCETVCGMTQTSFCLAQHSRYKWQLEQLVGTWSFKRNTGFVPSIEGLSRNHLKAFAQVKPGRWHRFFCTALSTGKPHKKQAVGIIFPGIIFRFIILCHRSTLQVLSFQTIALLATPHDEYSFLICF